MRTSCNGCRALRKGCSEDCSLRACLEWLKSAEAQANATVFLAKFYGRAGLINLINAGAPHLRPDIFRSLLYESCGRIIDPVYGSLGLITSGDWPRCQAAVEAVLRGTQLDVGRLQSCDIRHISKGSAGSLHGVRTRNRRKRSVSLADSVSAEYPTESAVAKFTITGWDSGKYNKYSVVDQESEIRAPSHRLLNFDEPPVQEPSEVGLGLELTLGLNPVLQTYLSTVIQISDSEEY